MPAMLADLKIRAATDTLASELRRLRRSIVAAAGTDHPLLPEAVAALLTHIGVYRSRLPGPVRDPAQRAGRNPGGGTGIGPALQVVAAALARRRRARHAAAAAVRRGDRQGRRGLPVLPRRPAGVAQRGGRRTAPVRRRRRGVPSAAPPPAPGCGRRR